MNSDTHNPPLANVVDAPVSPQDDACTAAAAPTVDSAPTADSAPASDAPHSPLRVRAQLQTVRLDARDLKPSWPLAIALLEQVSSWNVLALRLGTLALIQQCVRELAEPSARAETVARLRALTEALAHMPLEA